MRESHFLNHHTFNRLNKYYRTSINKFLKAINSFITLNKRLFRTLSMEFFSKNIQQRDSTVNNKRCYQ